MNGFLQHLLLTIRLNFRSRLPLIYGYLVPVIFLIAFAAVFHGVQHQLGQLLTITALGGACFGMPTALVAERERGVWRRYRLLPAPTAVFVASVMIARLVLVASSAGLQIVLALVVYHMPLPGRPAELAVAFLLVAWAFEGLGLVIAMLADTVPAVQALGQVIFLPMILIGGVGIPLTALPGWAGTIAGFMPGRYAVAAMDVCITGNGLLSARFDLTALAVIGAAACAAGGYMFRWEAAESIPTRRRWRAAIALAAWAAVGITAQITEKSQVLSDPPSSAYESITDAQVQSIPYDDLQDDNSVITPLVTSMDGLSPAIVQWTSDFRIKLAAWPPGNVADPAQGVGNLLAVAAVADLGENSHEGEIAGVIFDRIRARVPKDQLEKILAALILRPAEPVGVTSAEELGIAPAQQESDIKPRQIQYAKKLLGRLLGKLG